MGCDIKLSERSRATIEKEMVPDLVKRFLPSVEPECPPPFS
jgi:hypothetical protein